MKNHRIYGLGLVGIALGVVLSFIAAPVVAQSHKKTNQSADIIDTAVGAGQFKTLATALEAAGLIDALKGVGPFTVFAPTDDAFAKLPAGTVESLLQPENKEKLKAILLYHVVPGSVKANKVLKLNGQFVKTLEGRSVKIQTSSGVRVNDATVVKTDVNASNGVIHVIDSVLIPTM